MYPHRPPFESLCVNTLYLRHIQDLQDVAHRTVPDQTRERAHDTPGTEAVVTDIEPVLQLVQADLNESRPIGLGDPL